VKQIVHDPETQCDIFGAIRFYEDRVPGLGRRFLRALDETIGRIAANPKLHPFYEKPIRSCRIAGFPYRVLFVDERRTLLIVAVSHLARRPGWWRHRLDR
jgi:toxin ParE1/3/4